MQTKYQRPSIQALCHRKASDVSGGVSSNTEEPSSSNIVGDGKSRQPPPIIQPPVYYTQALGEDGGYIPKPDLT